MDVNAEHRFAAASAVNDNFVLHLGCEGHLGQANRSDHGSGAAVGLDACLTMMTGERKAPGTQSVHSMIVASTQVARPRVAHECDYVELGAFLDSFPSSPTLWTRGTGKNIVDVDDEDEELLFDDDDLIEV